MGLGGYGIPCGSCGCGPASSTPTRYAVAARGWTKPVLLGRYGGATAADMLPAVSVVDEFGYGLFPDDSNWWGVGRFDGFSGPVVVGKTGAIDLGQFLFTVNYGGGDVFVEVKWSDGYQWIRMNDTSYGATTPLGFEVIYRKPFASATSGSNQTGLVRFSAADVYSLRYGGAVSTDYSGVGEFAYLATQDEPTDFRGANLTITFSGGPAEPWALQSSQYFSVESLIDETFELALEEVAYLPAYVSTFPSGYGGDVHGDCYQDTRSAGSYGRGCKVAAITDGSLLSILASGSRTGGGPDFVFGCSGAHGGEGGRAGNATSAAFGVQFDSNWWECWNDSGVATTGYLPPWSTFELGLLTHINTGWNAYWGDAGTLAVEVS